MIIRPLSLPRQGLTDGLDLSRTLEVLETYAVPVVGYATDEFPAFYLVSSGERVSARVDTPEQAAALLSTHWQLGGAGVVLAQPVVADVAMAEGEFETALRQAEKQAADASVRGKELTPFLLSRLAEVTEGKTLRANQVLVVANARLAARVARVLKKDPARIT